MSVTLERQVVVVSNDGTVRREVDSVVARRPDARAIFFAERDGLLDAAVDRSAQVVVIDDEGQDDAVELIRRLKAARREASIVYLASQHSVALEGAVRRAGANFYTVKSSRDGDLTRVIEVLLGG